MIKTNFSAFSPLGQILREHELLFLTEKAKQFRVQLLLMTADYFGNPFNVCSRKIQVIRCQHNRKLKKN
jgi:hypothetical protein